MGGKVEDEVLFIAHMYSRELVASNKKNFQILHINLTVSLCTPVSVLISGGEGVQAMGISM